jgi:16S rRNA (guanine527-N7)-methyltransferase
MGQPLIGVSSKLTMNTSFFIKYFPNLTIQQLNLLEALADEVKYWNERINIISRKDIDHLNEHHLLHSLSICQHFRFEDQTNIIDVGTGGGFPGMVLAILFPKVNFTLLDSTKKKITVVESIAKSLNLTNVNPIWQRVEEHRHQYEFVTGRAVTDLIQFHRMTKHLITSLNRNNIPNGIIYLKGGDIAAEQQTFGNLLNVYKIHDFLPLPFFETKLILYLQCSNSKS